MMKTERIYLRENDPEVYLDTYISDPVLNYVRKAILVIPGGGYSCVCSEREGEPIAQAFIPYGYNAFVLSYSVAMKRTYPAQLIEASLAMKHIREHAAEYNIDPEQIFVTGFSAGGHLAGSLGTMWHRPEVYEAIDMPYGYNKPAGMMLIYPVIHTHLGTFQNLLGTMEPTQEQIDNVRIDLSVDEKTVPTFLVHTSNDQVVPIANSLDMASALARTGAQFELLVFPDAPHGLALGNAITAGGEPRHAQPVLAQWIAQAAAWAESLRK